LHPTEAFMAYDSPKTIRYRQQRAENKPARRSRRTKTTKQTDWNTTCDFHIARILENAAQGYSDAAYRHAAALGHMARELFREVA
jgi:hypothetical protein